MFSQNNKLNLVPQDNQNCCKVITTNKLLQFCVLVYYIFGNNVFVADSDAEEGDEDLSAELAALKMDASKPVKR